jgi:hypothetical protein
VEAQDLVKASDIKKIRSIGNTEAGQVLLKYMTSDLEAVATLLVYKVEATNVADISAAQARALAVQRYTNLLTGEIGELLRQHNLEEENEDE